MTQLNATRLGCSAGALGLSGAILEQSIKYANERIAIREADRQYKLIQQQIAEMKMEHESLVALVYKAAWLKDKNLPNVMETSMSKLYGAKAVVHAANECMKLHGSYGYSEEYPCGRFLRDSKQFETLEGTSNMHTMIVANAALGYARTGRRIQIHRPDQVRAVSVYEHSRIPGQGYPGSYGIPVPRGRTAASGARLKGPRKNWASPALVRPRSTVEDGKSRRSQGGAKSPGTPQCCKGPARK